MGSWAGSWAGAGAGSWAGAGAGAAAVSSEGVSMRLVTPRPFATVPAIEPRTKDRAIAATPTFLSVEDLGFGSCRSGWLSADVMFGRPVRFPNYARFSEFRGEGSPSVFSVRGCLWLRPRGRGVALARVKARARVLEL